MNPLVLSLCGCLALILANLTGEKEKSAAMACAGYVLTVMAIAIMVGK